MFVDVLISIFGITVKGAHPKWNSLGFASLCHPPLSTFEEHRQPNLGP